MRWCRPCGREHAAAECPVDELGRPNPPADLARPEPRGRAFGWQFTSGSYSTASTTQVNVILTVQPRPPDDPPDIGVPALVRT